MASRAGYDQTRHNAPEQPKTSAPEQPENQRSRGAPAMRSSFEEGVLSSGLTQTTSNSSALQLHPNTQTPHECSSSSSSSNSFSSSSGATNSSNTCWVARSAWYKSEPDYVRYFREFRSTTLVNHCKCVLWYTKPMYVAPTRIHADAKLPEPDDKSITALTEVSFKI